MSIANYQHEQDIERALHIERISKENVKLEVWVHEQDGHNWARFLDGVQVPPLQVVKALALFDQDMRNFSEDGMKGILSRREFRRLRDWLLQSGFIEWKNQQARAQGTQFTTRGYALLRTASEALETYPTLARTPPQNGGHGVRVRACVRGRAEGGVKWAA